MSGTPPLGSASRTQKGRERKGEQEESKGDRGKKKNGREEWESREGQKEKYILLPWRNHGYAIDW